MNEAKLKRLITDTSDMLKLSVGQTEYLRTVIELVYSEGCRDGLLEGKEIALKALHVEKKTFQEEWEEVRQK